MESHGGKNIALIIGAIFLFVAFIDGLPYEFFILLRFIICAVSLFLLSVAANFERPIFIYLFGFIAILFNPLIPVHLERELWLLIDFIVAIFMLISIFILKPKASKTEKQEKTDNK